MERRPHRAQAVAPRFVRKYKASVSQRGRTGMNVEARADSGDGRRCIWIRCFFSDPSEDSGVRRSIGGDQAEVT